MQTLGIDLAARNANTAAVRIEWSGKAARIKQILRGPTNDDHDDTWLLDAIRRPDITVGIDAPFGFPATMVDAVTAHADHKRWPVHATPDDLRFRATDRFVTETCGLRPLSSSSDLIAVVAWRCARLLSELGTSRQPVKRDGSSGVCEVYPSAALALWGIRDVAKGYKGNKPENAKRRDALLMSLVQRIGPGRLELDPATRSACRESDHVLDALLCALIARAAQVGDTKLPGRGQKALAKTEGWIHLPEPDSLGQLIKVRRRRA